MSLVLETPRLYLRKWQKADRFPFAQMNADPAVMRYFLKPLTEEESHAFVDRIEKQMAERGYGLWAVELKQTNRFIGFIGFNYTDFPSDFTPCIEIGWRLQQASWGHGYATEGALGCLEFGFRTLGFTEIFSFTSVLNTPSEKVMQKIGMRKLKEFAHPRIEPTNPLCPHVLYRITHTEFKS
jgi:RimJ/RimL family protein N-acetyltransferase